MAKNNSRCSFCGREKRDTNMLIAGLEGHICDYCVTQAYNIVNEEQVSKKSKYPTTFKLLKPMEIKKHLDEYVIGQEEAKKVMSVSVYNHYKRINQIKSKNKEEIEIARGMLKNMPRWFYIVFFAFLLYSARKKSRRGWIMEKNQIRKTNCNFGRRLAVLFFAAYLCCGMNLYSAPWWKVYFTDGKSINFSSPFNKTVCGIVLSAKTSVDVFSYELSDDNPSNVNESSLTSALIDRKNAGVTVRVIVDGANDDSGTAGTSLYKLKKAGITVKSDGSNTSQSHNKFIIVDNAKLWTGSSNLNDPGFSEIDNNGLLITNQTIAQNYTNYFTAKWNAVTTLHGPAKNWTSTVSGTVAAPRNNPVSDVTWENYFSPAENPVLNRTYGYLAKIAGATQSIIFDIYTFVGNAAGADDDMASGMYKQWKTNGKVVQGVCDFSQVSSYAGNAYDTMSKAKMDVKKKGDSKNIKNHNKVLLIMNTAGDDVVCTGSPNFTQAASDSNDENSLMIHDPLMMRQYLKYHKKLYYASDTTGGNGTEPSAPSPLGSIAAAPGSSDFTLTFTASGDSNFSRYYAFISTCQLTQALLDSDLTGTVPEVCDKAKGAGKKAITVASINYGDALSKDANYYFAVIQVNKWGRESQGAFAGPYKLSGGNVNSQGTGTASAKLSKSSAKPGQAYASLTLTLAPTDGSLGGGKADITIPSGWTVPQSNSAKGAGYVKSYISKKSKKAYPLIVVVSGQKVSISGIPSDRLSTGNGDTLKLVYYKFVTPLSAGAVTFSVSVAGSDGVLKPIAKQPSLNISKVMTSLSSDVDEEITTEDGEVKKASIGQNYPNPFNPSTNFTYFIAEDGRVTLKLYNVAGQEVDTVVDEDQVSGEHTVQYDSGAKLSRGVYYYRLALNGKEVGTKRAVVLK